MMGKIVLFLILLAISPISVSADFLYTINWFHNGDPVNNVRAVNHICDDNGCNTLGTELFDQTSLSNTITIPYPIPSPQFGYASYWFAACFRARKLAWTPNSSGAYTRNADFNKYIDCTAAINNFNAPLTATEG